MHSLEQLYRPVEAELEEVRATVSDYWAQALALVDGPSVSPPKAGGKLLRPALCLLSAGLAGAEDIARFIPLATAVELLHVAALTHDDVVDKADRRRGTASLNALWDERTAVLSGDYLVARAIELMASLGSSPLIAAVFGAVRRMTEGELATVRQAQDPFTDEDCLRLAEQKTATYFAATCTAPTYLIGDTRRDALHRFGLALGVAFQLIDDVLDIAQDESALGKPSCGDVTEGKKTLPVLFIREGLARTDRERFNAMVGSTITDSDREWLAARLDDTGARAHTETVARQYAADACAALAPFPASLHKDAMLGLSEFVLVRGS